MTYTTSTHGFSFLSCPALSPLYLSSPLFHSLIQSDSFLCDCQLHWLPDWLVTRGLQAGVNATCAHPESLKGMSLFQAPSSSFVCGELSLCIFSVYMGGRVEQEALEAQMGHTDSLALFCCLHTCTYLLVCCFCLALH